MNTSQRYAISAEIRPEVNEYLCNLTEELGEEPLSALKDRKIKWKKESHLMRAGTTTSQNEFVAHYNGFNIVTEKSSGKLQSSVEFVETPITLSLMPFTDEAEGLAKIIGVELE